MTLIKKKCTLHELIQLKDIYFRVYSKVTDFERVLMLEEKVVSPIEKILSAHNKKLMQYREELQKDESKKQELDRLYNEMLLTKVDIQLAVVSKDEVRGAGLNVFEYIQIKEIIK